VNAPAVTQHLGEYAGHRFVRLVNALGTLPNPLARAFM
jgi:hypothetical protein